MDIKKRFLSFLLVAAVSATSLAAGASAFMNGPDLTDEQKTALQEAREAGDFEALQELREQYGLKNRGPGFGRHGMQNDLFADLTDEQKTALDEAHESGDMDAVHELLEEYGITPPNKEAYDALTDEQKAALQEAREAGDFEALQALHEEYGLKNGFGERGPKGRGFEKGFKNGTCDLKSTIEDIEVSDLSDAEKQALIEGQQEERLAQDTYAYLAGLYDERVFSNISRSETQHIESIGALLDRYGIDQTEGYGPYADLYDQLTAKGEISLQDALEVGITIEITDIDDLDEMIALTDNEDIKMVYEHLRRASLKHLRAFTRVLEMNDMETEIEWESYLEGVEDEGHWSGKRGQRDGNTGKGMRRGGGGNQGGKGGGNGNG